MLCAGKTSPCTIGSGGTGGSVSAGLLDCPSNKLAASNPLLSITLIFSPLPEIPVLRSRARDSTRFNFYRPPETADFNNFAWHTRIAENAFLLIAITQLAYFLIRHNLLRHYGCKHNRGRLDA